VTSLFQDPALPDHQDHVRHPDGGEPVRHQHGDRAGAGPDLGRGGGVPVEQVVFGLGVEGGWARRRP
jgi:hypothetical protein